MASAFSSWETDPFFAAAEDVQQSADRMESAYRSWMYKRALAEENPAAQRTMNLCNDDVATALGTTKWQLEEFAKAVNESDTFLLREEVAKRYFSFIEAIQNQIFLIEDTLHKCIDTRFPNPSHSIELNGDERDQLEMFLAGSTSSCATDKPVHDVKQRNSSLALSETHAPTSSKIRPLVMGLVCGNENHGTSSISNEFSADACKPQHDNVSPEIVEANTELEEEVIKTQVLQDGMASMGHMNSIPMVHSSQTENAIGHSSAKAHRIKKPPNSKNGFRRWKNGSLRIHIKGDTMSHCKDKQLPDLEMGYFHEDSRSPRQNYLQRADRWRLRRFSVPQYMAVCNSSGQRASFGLLLLCLGCMYFWFLSSLVPYINVTFPHGF